MNDDNLEIKPEKSTRTGKNSKNKAAGNEPPVDLEMPKVFDKEAAHRKVMMVMIGLFLAILAIMLLLENHVEFAASGGM